MRQVKAGLHLLWGTEGEHRWRGESSRKMGKMLWRGDKWSQSVLATPGEYSTSESSRCKKKAYLITAPPQSENFVSHLFVSLFVFFLSCIFSITIYSSILSLPSAFPWQNSVIWIQFMNVGGYPVHYPLKTFLVQFFLINRLCLKII